MNAGTLILIVGIVGAILAVMIARSVLNKRDKKEDEETIAIVSPPPKIPRKVYWIQGISGDMNQRIYLLENQLFFGRYDWCDICFPEDKKSISRQHAKVYLKDGKVCLMDLQSLVGTYYDSNHIAPNEEIELTPGDCFGIGKNNDYFKLIVSDE